MSGVDASKGEHYERLQPNEVFDALGTSSKGQSQLKIADLQKQYGVNEINEVKGESTIIKFLKNFISMMAILLWVGGAVAFFFTDTPQLGIAI